MPDSTLSGIATDSRKAALLELMISNNTASYKLFWFKAIVTLVECGRSSASYREMGALMISHAWDPVVFFKLRLGAADQTAGAIKLAKSVLNLTDYAEPGEITRVLSGDCGKTLAASVKGLTRYVKQRFLAPCLIEYLGKDVTENTKDTALREAISAHPDAGPYRMDAAGIELNEDWSAFIRDNLPLIKAWLDFKLARYLQAKNPSVPAVVCKLRRPVQRDLAPARRFWDAAMKREDVTEIYSRRSFTEENLARYGSISIDHFIPWRFVLHDELWNLTPVFQTVNSSKNDRLPDPAIFLEPLSRQQFRALSCLKGTDVGKRALESFLTVDAHVAEEINDGSAGALETFSEALGRALCPLYEIAANMGFEPWRGSCAQS